MNTFFLQLTSAVLLLSATLGVSSCERFDVKPQNARELGQQIDGLIRDRTRRLPYQPAVAAAVVRNGELLTTHVYGTRQPFGTEAVTDRTLFPMASAAKLITSVTVMLAVQQGKLRLQQPITDFVEGLPTAWQGITLRHLLTHTDGLKDGFLNPKMGQLPAGQQEQLSRQQYVQFAAEWPVNFKPGERTQYGQTGFVLLSMALERAYNQPFERIVQTNVLVPLGMTETYFTSKSFRLGDYSMDVYEPDGGRFKAVRLGYGYADYATAAVSTTLRDMITFAKGIQQNRLLTAETRRQLTTPTDLSQRFTLGWTYQRIQGQVAVGHSGGQSVVITYLPAQNTTTILLSNTTDEALLRLGNQLAEKAAQYTSLP